MVEEFRDGDQPYRDWVAAHPDGFVINIQRSLNRSDARLHRADCRTITGVPSRGRGFVGSYIKICSDSREALREWALTQARGTVRSCGTCHPNGHHPPAAGPGPSWTGAPLLGGANDLRHEFDGPQPGIRQAWMWADRYIPFERLSPSQHAARAELRRRLTLVSAEPGEILHASYMQPKRADTDLENLLFYNIGGACFKPSARHGLRFELTLQAGKPPPSGRNYQCCYHYRGAPADEEPVSWQPTRLLAAFTDADLGSFRDHKRLARTWLAVRQSGCQARSGQLDALREPFAVFLRLRAPQGAITWPSPELIKPLFDGVVAACQAHGDASTLQQAATRIGRDTGQDAGLIADLLADNVNAVLAAKPRLVHLRGESVMWNPADALLFLGQVLIETGAGHRWQLSGEIHSVRPRH